MTIHDFDMARFVTASEVVDVYADGAARVDPAIGEIGDIDTAVIMLRHENGCLTIIDNSRRAAYGYDQRVEAFGSAGVAMSENPTVHSGTFRGGRRGTHAGHPGTGPLHRELPAGLAGLRRLCPRRRVFARLGPGRPRAHRHRPGGPAVAARAPARPNQRNRSSNRSAAMNSISHWIGGRVEAGTSGRQGPVYNPATGEQAAEVDFASGQEVAQAVAVAKAAFPTWRATSLANRAEILFRMRDLLDGHRKELATIVTAEHGKVLSDALGEVARGMKASSTPAASPTCSKVGSPSRLRPALTSTPSANPSVWSRASRHSTSRPWCRCGCSPTPSPAAIPSSSSHPKRTPAPRCSSPSCGRALGCRRGSSTSSMATRWRSMPSSSTRT
jgi:hypothetical protein